ncbi:extracellular solute-binding protein [Occultella gossypii]|uniref:Extracellular solute-binding protein n=1 Tax=Occultella gossypii TaxID=2800820 RepID=A0ABS7SFC7_9MICO|nr:extracellular solute-binding protein [Occultella gossypii]MBZ2197963.1 extracellular solute-binding protein [Occultella gossypii]
MNSGSPQLTRRALFGAMGAGAAAAALAGCSPMQRAAVTGTGLPSDLVTFWNFFGGGDGARMTEMVADYQATYPDIPLRSTTLTWGNPFYTKLALGTLSRQPPLVASCHVDRLVTPVDTGLLRPFDLDELAEWGITEDKFFPRAWEASHRHGELWAIPLDFHPLAVYYNKPIAEQAGLLTAEGTLAEPVGTQAFEDMLAAAKDVMGTPSTGFLNDAAGHYRVFYSLHSQAGGEMVSEDGRTAILTKEVFLEVVSWMRSLTHEKELLVRTIDPGGAIANFVNNRFAFFFSGGWERPTFVDAGVDFGIHSWPKVYDKHVAWDGTHSFVIPTYDEDPARIASALHFISGMLERSATWVEGGHMTTWLPVQDDPRTQEIQPHYENLPVDGTLYDPQAWYAGSGGNLQTVIGQPLAACTQGHISVEDAYDQALAGLRELAATEPPK